MTTHQRDHQSNHGRASSPAKQRRFTRFPAKQGLYDPAREKDSCGVGFIAHLKGERSHAIVADALEMLARMDHRGACGCEANTGDGAGILTKVPHELFSRVARDELGFELPGEGAYGVGMIFMPRDDAARRRCREVVSAQVKAAGQTLLGWRRVPTDADYADVGNMARSTEPVVEQVFIGSTLADRDDFDRRLYLLRKIAEHALAEEPFYVCSMHSRTIVYKGQLTSTQVPRYYADLRASDYLSHLAMVHSRFSTNTFPSWDRAQPMRAMSHNGEINAVRGNRNWMIAREGLLQSAAWGDDVEKLKPIIDEDTSDSGMFDNVLEFLMLAGRSLPHVGMMMIPEAWENHESMPPVERAFYEFHANLMEPWDGPASISFTDGRVIGATLDRNGLRPSRYYVTTDDRVIMASEVGVVDIDPRNVVKKGRLEPGRMFLCDFEQGRIIADDELKQQIASAQPYGQWLADNRIDLASLPKPTEDYRPGVAAEDALPLMQAFGYTAEHMQMILAPMIRKGEEAIGSMGNDAALAVLSDKPRLLYDYFKQLFAQVTNPPIDPIREAIVMSLQSYIGPEGNLLDASAKNCRRLLLHQPVLRNEELAAIRDIGATCEWKVRDIDITFAPTPAPGSAPGSSPESGPGSGGDAKAGLLAALDRICDEATAAIDEGYQLIVLTDKATGPARVPLPSLLAVGAVHHHLVRRHSRTKIGLILESGEAREVQHFACLIGYGADAINPYLAFEALMQIKAADPTFEDTGPQKVVDLFIKAANKGVLKVMSKMGISTIASYKGAQIFEAIGLKSEVVDRAFAGTASRLQGAGFDVIADEAVRRHEIGFPRRENARSLRLPNPGEYHWRADGERHGFSPTIIADLQAAARTNSRAAYEKFAKLVNDDARNRCTLRGLLRIRKDLTPIPIEQVEPAREIVRRFRTGAMSLGSLSREAHETLALAMNRIGGKSNSGEGGEDPVRFTILNNPDGSVHSKRSAIKQVASGRFGVTSYYLANGETLQIKIAQGAKPGEGGQLPAHKVDEYIAKIRYSTPGVGLISPPPHHDIYSIEDLAQLIFDLKNANRDAQVSVKLVSEVGVGTVAAGVAKAHADHILISGHDGGTGASPLTSIKYAGLPWELGLAETHQTLVLNDLRSRVRVETDGGLRTGRDVAVAACLGAEEFGFATAPLVVIGCIMMRKCHLNTCPVGICTQDPELRRKFTGTPEHVVNYLFMIAEEMRSYMAQLGVKRVDDLIGRVDLLQTDDAIRHWKADGVDLTPILTPARKPYPEAGVRRLKTQDHGIDNVLDRQLIEHAQPALQNREPVEIRTTIRNTDRAVGTMLSHEVSKLHGEGGLPDDTIRIHLTGNAGQSLGAFLARGVMVRLEGDANDYVGKGLSGGKVIVTPPPAAAFKAEENVIIGNVALYGATGGQAYFRGLAAERFGVRNSGAWAVVEGVGDHGCEYMTGGRVVVLGPTGRNFAAGMSGGIAYVWDPNRDFLTRCNLGLVDLGKLEEDADAEECRRMIEAHLDHTGSPVAEHILADWDATSGQFVKVMPIDYRRVLRARAAGLATSPELEHG